MKDLQDIVERESGDSSAQEKTEQQAKHAKQTDFECFKATESAKFNGMGMSDEEISSVVLSRWETKKKTDDAAKEKKRKRPIEPEKWSKELLNKIMEEAGLPKGTKKLMANRIMLVPTSDDEGEDEDE